MGISKVIYGGNTLIDLTSDDVTAEKLLSGTRAHGADGEPIVGSCTYDADTQDATATADEILTGKSAYNKGNKIDGAMINNGSVHGTIDTKDGSYIIPRGYHDGAGKVQISSVEQAKLISDNIREGVTILGVVGGMSGSEDVKPQTKSVSPSSVEQVVLPDEGYNYLSQVTVAAIPYSEFSNSAGGITVTIG